MDELPQLCRLIGSRGPKKKKKPNMYQEKRKINPKEIGEEKNENNVEAWMSGREKDEEKWSQMVKSKTF